MKYIKLYDSYNYRTFQDWLKKESMRISIYSSHTLNKNWWKKEKLSEIKILECNIKRILDLNGIEDFINLRELNCQYNKIESLEPIKDLIRLEKLICSNNKLTSLKGIENLINLKSINASDNKLNNIEEMKNLVNIKTINLIDNSLTSLEFGNFSIESFELEIDETDLRRFKKLNLLNCAGNQFSNE